jgi:hypothetical protein
VVTDTDGYRYLLDERSLRRPEPNVCTFLLKRIGPRETLQDKFRLDFQACTLQKGSGQPELIRPGTVADTLRRELAEKL